MLDKGGWSPDTYTVSKTTPRKKEGEVSRFRLRRTVRVELFVKEILYRDYSN